MSGKSKTYFPDFFIEYEGSDNYFLRLFFAVLRDRDYAYNLAHTFQKHDGFTTELTEPNKIAANLKEMRGNGWLNSKEVERKKYVWANRDVFKQVIGNAGYDLDQAMEMFAYLVDELALPYQRNITVFRDYLDIVLFSLYKICFKVDMFQQFYPYVCTLFYLPKFDEEKDDFPLVAQAERWSILINEHSLNDYMNAHFLDIKQYLMRNKGYMKEFLSFLTDCLVEVELKYTHNKGTYHLEGRFADILQLTSVKHLLEQT